MKKAAGEMVQRPDGTSVRVTRVEFQRKGPDDPMVHLIVRNLQMQEVVEVLSRMMGRRVLDQTGLKGEFDFNSRL